MPYFLARGPMRFQSAAFARLGQHALAEVTLGVADKMNPDSQRWEQWLLSAFQDENIAMGVIDEVRAIRNRTGTSQ